MVFNVYLDPKVIENAVSAVRTAPHGVQFIFAMLRGFVSNCLLFDFEDERLKREIRKALEALPQEGNDRSDLMKIFAVLAKRNRFVAVFEPDYMSEKSDLEQVLPQLASHRIQLLVSDEEWVKECAAASGAEFSKLSSYQNSNFEKSRNEYASYGLTFKGGEMRSGEFLENTFGNALRHARQIQIVDRLLGTRYSDNYIYSIKKFMKFLECLLHDPERCEIVFHVGNCQGRNDYLCSTINNCRTTENSRMVLKVSFYTDSSGGADLPHERYILTNQFAFDIGRGMDFFDTNNEGKNRDVEINLKSLAAITAKLEQCAGSLSATESL